MIKIILVEDEPSAMRILKSIIELKCEGFQIVATAENGSEGLEQIRLLKPDIVITDIKMGGMDGIELISKVKEELPSIYSIIVSGYQDFQYAKGAIKGGASDYLLKPVNALQLKTLLHSIKEKLKIEYNEKGSRLLKKLISGYSIENFQLERFLPFKKFCMAILRKNGLPSRFASKHGSRYDGLIFDEVIVNDLRNSENIWYIYGRDEQEIIFLYADDIVNKNYFENYIKGIVKNLGDGYHTIVFSLEIFDIREVGKIIDNIYKILDHSIVIGASQNIYITNEIKKYTETRIILEASFENKINYLLSNNMYKELKTELSKMSLTWEKEKRTQLWIENYIRQILQYIEKHCPNIMEEHNYNLEFLIDEALYYSRNFQELTTNLWDVVERITKNYDKKKQKMGSLEFFKSTQRYIEENFSEQISLQSLCSVFEISQPYLSRLFRKYENTSFNEYITKKRIEKAKKLIEENPKMPLKDVASFVGFSDPFYFSRVFRTVTGIPPSEYNSTDRID